MAPTVHPTVIASVSRMFAVMRKAKARPARDGAPVSQGRCSAHLRSQRGYTDELPRG